MKKFASLILIFINITVLGKGKFLPSTFEANFVKKEKSVLSGKTLKAQGVLYYKYPGRIRLEESGKKKSLFISNPFKTYYYKPPVFKDLPGELTINSSNNYPLTKFFDSLNEGLKSNDLYQVKKGSNEVSMSFTKKGLKDLKIKSAVLGFKSKVDFKEMTYVEITLDSNKKLKFELEGMKVNKKLNKNLFTFVPPKHTRVSR